MTSRETVGGAPTPPTATATATATGTGAGPGTGTSRTYPWLVFALAFGLLLSDYMSRQVLSAVFPVLKTEWSLSDAHLASLSSVVALMVGLLTLPLSLVADRWGRVRSLAVMAVVWSVATLLCAVAGNYHEMLAARFLVGVGEAAYGSVGIAVVLSVFAPRVHATLGGAFMAGGSFGSVVGVAVGGSLAVHVGWRWSFAAMAAFGLLLVAVFRAVVSEQKLDHYAVEPRSPAAPAGGRAPVTSLFTNPALLCAYIGGGLQMFTPAVLLSWTPSYFNRYYHLQTDEASVIAAVFVLLIGSGMVICGIISDRFTRSRSDASGQWTSGVVFCVVSLVCLSAGFGLAPGAASLILIGCGSFFAAGSSGPTAAIVAELSHRSVRATGLGTLTVANNVLGLALGPFVVGMVADHLGLAGALRLAPLMYLAAIAVLLLGRRLAPAGKFRFDRLAQPTAR
ncbi:MFS transporter [Streptomyces sp. NPDC050529]|uniref:MFS transporter n=1 Tax=Streptomyces sp. NPDC050529 TaxID=3365624 RepID=UPI00379E62C9